MEAEDADMTSGEEGLKMGGDRRNQTERAPRGKALSLVDLKQIGATKLMESLPCGVKRSSLTVILKDLCDGKSLDRLARARKEKAAGAGRPPVRSERSGK